MRGRRCCKNQTTLRVEDRDRGRHLVERAAVRFVDPRDLAVCDFRFGHVERDSGGTPFRSGLEHFQRAPFSRDDGRYAAVEDAGLVSPARGFRAHRLVEEFEIARRHLVRIGNIDRRREGAVCEHEFAVAVADPDRRRHQFQKVTHQFDLVFELLVLCRHRGMVALRAGHVAQPQHRDAADRAALGLDMFSARRQHRKSKRLAAGTQRIDCRVHGARRFRAEPGAEGENPAGGLKPADGCDITEHRGFGIQAPPDHHDLRLGEQERRHAVGFRAQPRDLTLGFGTLDCCHGARAQSAIAVTTANNSTPSVIVSEVISCRVSARPKASSCSISVGAAFAGVAAIIIASA